MENALCCCYAAFVVGCIGILWLKVGRLLDTLPNKKSLHRPDKESLQDRGAAKGTERSNVRFHIRPRTGDQRRVSGPPQRVQYSERTDCGIGEATPVESAADKRTMRAAVKREELPAWHSAEESAAKRLASGRLTLFDRLSPGASACGSPQANGIRAVCRISDGVLTLAIEQQRTAADEQRREEVVAQVPLEALAVGLHGGRANMFAIATHHKKKLYDEIYCFADNPARRNKWVALFQRMGVPTFDLRDWE